MAKSVRDPLRRSIQRNLKRLDKIGEHDIDDESIILSNILAAFGIMEILDTRDDRKQFQEGVDVEED